MKTSSLLAGVSGEYFVAAELSRRGHIASISLRNTRGVDILATNSAASRSITIQCKTNQLARKIWLLNEKSEVFTSDTHYYIFVAIGKLSDPPNYHIVPSRDVAEYVRENHRNWLQTPGRLGQKHSDTPMRQFKDREDKYLNKWELLGL